MTLSIFSLPVARNISIEGDSETLEPHMALENEKVGSTLTEDEQHLQNTPTEIPPLFETLTQQEDVTAPSAPVTNTTPNIDTSGKQGLSHKPIVPIPLLSVMQQETALEQFYKPKEQTLDQFTLTASLSQFPDLSSALQNIPTPSLGDTTLGREAVATLTQTNPLIQRSIIHSQNNVVTHVQDHTHDPSIRSDTDITDFSDQFTDSETSESDLASLATPDRDITSKKPSTNDFQGVVDKLSNDAGDIDHTLAQKVGLSDKQPLETTEKPTALQTTPKSLSTSLPHVIQDQVVVAVKNNGTTGKSEISMTLRPDYLGRVTIKIDTHQDGTSFVVVATERSETRDLLQQDSSRLASLLQEADIDVNEDNISYDYNDTPHGHTGDDSPEHSSHHQLHDTDEPLSLTGAAIPITTPEIRIHLDGTWSTTA